MAFKLQLEFTILCYSLHDEVGLSLLMAQFIATIFSSD